MNRKSGKLEAHMRIARLEDRLRHLPSERLKYSSRGKGENGLRNVSLSSDGNAPLRRTFESDNLTRFSSFSQIHQVRTCSAPCR